jgi:hypothetical protein
VTAPHGPATAAGPAEPTGPPAAVVPARWGADDVLPLTITSLEPTDAGIGVPVQRLHADAAPTTPFAAPAIPAMREIVFPPRDDLDGGASPGPDGASPAMGPTPQPTSAAAVAMPTTRPVPAVQRATVPLSLARPVAPAPAPATTPAPSPGGPVVARIVADPSAPGAPATVQTSPGQGGIPVGTFTATPVVQREEAAPTPADNAGQGTARSDRELDELAKALFGRLRTQLKSEVIHEREAKGLGFDAF